MLWDFTTNQRLFTTQAGSERDGIGGASRSRWRAEAEPSYSPLPPGMPRHGPIDEYWTALHRGYRALAARGETRSDSRGPVQRVARVGQSGARRSDGHPARSSADGAGAGGLGQERRGALQHCRQDVSRGLEGARVGSRQALHQGRRRRGCSAPAPLPDRRGKCDRPGKRVYGPSWVGRERALQSWHGGLSGPIPRRHGGVRLT